MRSQFRQFFFIADLVYGMCQELEKTHETLNPVVSEKELIRFDLQRNEAYRNFRRVLYKIVTSIASQNVRLQVLCI